MGSRIWAILTGFFMVLTTWSVLRSGQPEDSAALAVLAVATAVMSRG